MPHIPYQPRSTAPLAVPLSPAMEEMPLPHQAPQPSPAPSAPKARPTTPRYRGKAIGLSTMNLQTWEPDHNEIFKYVTSQEPETPHG